VIATLLSSTTDSAIVNAIPAAKFASLGINPFSLPATSLPLSYVIFQYYTQNLFYLIKI
jgi:hypothetical protein